MGCASSTPMIQTSGSEMLKAATHVATDATKTAEDTVEGLKDSVGKTLESAKDSMTTTIEGVAHEVEHVIKEKIEMVEDAKDSLMEKLHLKDDEQQSSDENSKAEERMKHNNDNSDLIASSAFRGTVNPKELKEHTDTETDSLKTSTPEPEIEQALSKSHEGGQEHGDDNPPTPKPTLSELENLTAEILQQQQQQQSEATKLVNDIKMGNEPLIKPIMHENIKRLDSNNAILSTTDSNTIKDNEPHAAALTINDIKSNIVHNAPHISTEVIAIPLQALTSTKSPQPLIPLTLAKTAIATATAAATAPTRDVSEKNKFHTPTAAPKAPTQPSSRRQLNNQASVQVAASKNKVSQQRDKVVKGVEENRPRTTEWEKFADMLAQLRKFNPHDALRRGSTFTKFGGGSGIGQLRERPVLGHHMRNALDDDSSDTPSNFHTSPLNSQRSSARAAGRVQHIRNRPNTGSNHKNFRNSTTHNGGSICADKPSSNITNAGRKFDFNPARSRVNEFVSSNTFTQSPLETTEPTHTAYAHNPQANESVKSPANRRSHHSRNETIILPPLEQQGTTSTHITNQHYQHKQCSRHDYVPSGLDHNGSSLSLQNYSYRNETSVLTPQSSNTSLYSNSSYEDSLHVRKTPTTNVRRLPTNYPTVKNTSSFLAMPRCTSFGLTKSYTDLYFSATSNKENNPNTSTLLYPKERSPYRSRNNCKNTQ